MSPDSSLFDPNYEASSLVDLLRWRALHHSDQRAYTFLEDGETNEIHLTYGELDRRARAIAATLQKMDAIGARALLLYPPGLDYVAGFFGCLYAGIIAVPAYPPDIDRLDRTLPRLQAMVSDARASVALTTSPILSIATALFGLAPSLATLRWIATDSLEESGVDNWTAPGIDMESMAFLQYTSGSTRMPKGVMLSHGNLLHNLALISHAFEITPSDVGMFWLPPYHDMGLIGGILEPVYSGVTCILMSPIAFLQRPIRWLQAITRYKTSISGGPNFAYDLCARKLTPEHLATLDLSCWSLAFNGAEPIRRETLDRFAATFAPCGFRREAFYTCYGLAEATLIVSGGSRSLAPVDLKVRKSALERQRAVLPDDGVDTDALTLISSGHPLPGQQVIVVQPESHTVCSPDQIGEIWISGLSVARGYWDQARETQQTFQAHLLDGISTEFLRTGDLGFLKDGELFITGRMKDLIIIRGRNYYPQDIELTVEQSHPALRPGCCAAFSIEAEGEERLVVVQEVDTRQALDVEAISGVIRRAVAETHQLHTHAIVLIEPRSIPKTSSGKIQRHACREGFLAGTLAVMNTSILSEAHPPAHAAGLTRDDLSTVDPADRLAVLEAYLCEHVAELLRIAPYRLDIQQPLSSLGLDSVMAVDLVSEIQDRLNVTLPIAGLMQDTTIIQLASQVMAALGGASSASTPAFASLVSQPVEEAPVEYPLSHGQRALWFLQQLKPGSIAHNVVHGARIPGGFDVAAFQRAFQKVVDRHPTLRTTFAAPNDEPIQRVHPHMDVDFRFADASSWTPADFNRELAEEMFRPFDLEYGSQMRVAVYARSPQEHVVLLSMHHTVTDMWSLAIIMSELGAYYTSELTGVAEQLKPLKAQYADYVRAQKEMLASPEGERLWTYWRTQLAGELPVLNLPTDRPRLPIQTDRGAACLKRLGLELTHRLRDLAKANGTSLYTLTLATFQVLLHRHTGQEDILVGFPKAARSRQMARVVGYFINPIVLRGNLSGDPTFRAFLDQMHHTVQGGNDHDAFPFPLLVERLQPARDLSRSPLFQVMFSWHKTTRLVDSERMASFAMGEEGQVTHLGALHLAPLFLESRVTPFDLTLLMAESDDELAATIEYNVDLFEAATIERMLEHFHTLLEGIVADPDQRVSHLPLLSETERQRMLVEWNDTARDFTHDRCIHQLFEAQVERTPDAPAVVFEDAQLTYREVNRRANQLAHYLQKLGIGPEVFVGICVERSPDMVIGMLGVLKAGGAYMPLDPSYPPERLAFMLEDSQVPVLLTQASLAPSLPAHRARSICLDTEWDTIAQESADLSRDDNPSSEVSPENLAYVIYTSGSTGTPKGVLIQHRGLCNLVTAQIQTFQVGPDSRVLQFASFSFDASVSEMFMALASGATLHLARRESLLSVPSLVRYLRDQAITTITLSPSLLALLPSDDLPSLHTVISAGESCPWDIAARWTPGRRFFNAYGPTEATIGPTLYRVEHLLDATATVPIGRPIANIQVYLLDPHRQPVPIGTPGEIHIGGVGLARGYLNRPDLTAEKFIAVDGGQWTVMHALTTTYSPLPARLYRTGDLARYLSDGNLEFLGRVDQQVKVRGFRIELGEIEATLRTHPGVRDSVVLAREDTPGDRRLAAYIVPHTTSAPAASDLKRFLKDRLPDHMLPSAYMILEAFPLLSSGKVDRKALPAPESTRPDLDVVFVMPRNEIERSIAMIWQEVLNVETVGIHDNFFDLGGHSLLAVKVHSRLQEVFKRDISMVELFKYPTVSALAKFLADGGNGHSVQISRTRAEKQKEAIEQRQKMMRAAANRRTAQRQRNQRD